MCAYSEGSGETARMRRLAWAFAGILCDGTINSELAHISNLQDTWILYFDVYTHGLAGENCQVEL